MDGTLVEIDRKIYDIWETIQNYNLKLESAEDDCLIRYLNAKINKKKRQYWSLIKKRDRIVKKLNRCRS